MKLSNEQILNAIKMYNAGKSCYEIASFYGDISPQAIWGLLKRRGVKIRNYQPELQRKFPLKEDYFKNIDSYDKAYFLGLFYADGCVYANGDGIAAKISLQSEDGYVLRYLSKEIYGQDRCKEIKRRKVHWEDNVQIDIFGSRFCSHLVKLGCVKRKTPLIRFNDILKNISRQFVFSFLLGFFDGDGSVYTKNFKGTISFTSNKYFIEEMHVFFLSIGINSYIKRQGKSSALVISKKEHILFMFKKFYIENRSPFLTRKKKKMLEVLRTFWMYRIKDPLGKDHIKYKLNNEDEKFGLRKNFLFDVHKGKQKNNLGWSIEKMSAADFLTK